ncbi:hypothetical protein [Burkholderia pseudomallei]|uniref:hypothetical protein n=1 Tax=Burkholderia pseudomallei TaxID=28450 RepID=UPI0012B84DC4|nr:hypothetical protein [Burkholderia pseudomallei]
MIVPARFDVSAPRRAALRCTAGEPACMAASGVGRNGAAQSAESDAVRFIGARPRAAPAPDRSEMEQHVPNSNRRCAARGGPFISARPSGGMVWIVHFRFPALRAAQHETHRHNQETT